MALVRANVSENISPLSSDKSDMFSEKSVQIRVKRCSIPEYIRHSYRRENIPTDGILGPCIVKRMLLTYPL
jgi:hypothetical protein